MAFLEHLTQTKPDARAVERNRLSRDWMAPFAVLVDFVLTIGAALVAEVVYHEIVPGRDANLSAAAATAIGAFSYFALIAGWRKAYAIDKLDGAAVQFKDVTVCWASTFVMLTAGAFLFKLGAAFSRGSTLLFFLLGWLSLIGWRSLMKSRTARAGTAALFAARKTLLVSDRAQAHWRRELPRHGYEIADEYAFPREMTAADMLGRLRRAVAADPAIEAIILAMDWRDAERIDALVEECAILPLPVRLLPDRAVARFGADPAHVVGAFRLAELQRAPLSRFERTVKRAVDIVLSALLLFMLSPLLAAAALLIRVDSPGPAIFRQTRHGFNGQAFRILKFRTMHVMDDGPAIRQASRDDARLTRVGRLLRRSSIDELPQLVNVLRGEMSLVGPRPHAAAHNEFYDLMIDNYAYRHHVKPGLTGWAQVNGSRGATTTVAAMRRRVGLDLWYVNNWSLWLDVRILVGTGLTFLGHEDAY